MKKIVSVLVIASIFLMSFGTLAFAGNGDVTVLFDSGKTGNIFFDYETPEFEVVYSNQTNENINIVAQYSVKAVDGTGNVVGESIVSGEKNITIPANSTFDDNIVLNVSKYALYKLIVKIGDSEYSTSFSLCPRVENQNYTLGVHQPNANSENNSSNGLDPDVLLKLMHDSGMGLLRDGIRWRSCKWDENSTFTIYNKAQQVLNAVDKYDIEFLCILSSVSAAYAEKSGDTSTIWGLVGENDLDEYANEYIKGVIEAPEAVGRIAAVEIANEPEWVTNDSDGNSFTGTGEGQTEDGKNSYLGGQAYGRMLKTAYSTIKNSSNPVPVAGMSSITASGDNYKVFLDGVKSAIGNETAMDVASFHPYTPWKRNTDYTTQYADTGFAEQKSKFTDTLNEKAINRTDSQAVWNTEVGYTTGINNGDNCYVVSDEEQAKRLLRTYNASKMDDFNSKTYIHKLVSAGTDEDDREGNFGILESVEAETPLAAKYSFLAVANINRMLDGATAVQDLSTPYAVISKYTGDKDVYMMYSKYYYNNSASYSVEDEGYTYYDMYGNEIAKPSVLTTAPVYAVSEKISKVTPEEYRESRVTGSLGIENAYSMISLSVSDGVDFNGANGLEVIENAVYFDQSLTDGAGNFYFKLPLLSELENVTANVSKNGSAFANVKVIKPGNRPVELKLLSGVSKVEEVSVNCIDFENVKIHIDFGDENTANSMTAICALYDGDKLQSVGMGTVADSSANEVNISFDKAAEEYNKIKLMLWHLDSLIPVCDVDIIE